MVGLLSSCTSDKKDETTGPLSILTVSSDPYATDLTQRFAFSIFESSSVASKGSLNVVLESPDGKIKEFTDVSVRDKGIPEQGIFSIPVTFTEPGIWNLSTTFEGEPLELAVKVAESATAPALGSACPDVNTPTQDNPLDAEILCTRFEGTCEFHTKSVPQLLATKKPFVVLFATPARCQTSYCGPVLELTRNVAKNFDLEVVHIEIYPDETSQDVLDAVKKWNLPSEPWLFGVKADGTIDSRIDGAFDQSEIEEAFEALS